MLTHAVPRCAAGGACGRCHEHCMRPHGRRQPLCCASVLSPSALPRGATPKACSTHVINRAPPAPPPQPQHHVRRRAPACVPPDFTHFMLLLSFLHLGGLTPRPCLTHGPASFTTRRRPQFATNGLHPTFYSCCTHTPTPQQCGVIKLSLCCCWPRLNATGSFDSCLANKVAHCRQCAVNRLDGLSDGLCGGACSGAGRGGAWSGRAGAWHLSRCNSSCICWLLLHTAACGR